MEDNPKEERNLLEGMDVRLRTDPMLLLLHLEEEFRKLKPLLSECHRVLYEGQFTEEKWNSCLKRVEGECLTISNLSILIPEWVRKKHP